MIDVIGGDDEALEHVENRETIKPLLEALDPREKHILTLRFFRGMTQSQIAAEIGISQMHVSRLLARTLERLRESLDEPTCRPASAWRPGDRPGSLLLGERPQRRGVEAPDQHHHREHRQRGRDERGRAPAAEAPRDRRAGSAGPARSGARAQDSSRAAARRTSASPTPYTRKNTRC